MTHSVSVFPTSTLAEHAKIQPGFAFKSDQFTDNGSDVPLVKGENVQQGYIDWAAAKYWPAFDAAAYREYRLDLGDVVLAMDRPWVTAGLKWAYIKPGDPASLLVQRVSRIRAKSSLDQTYLRCLISSSYFSAYIQPIVTGVNVPHISGRQIGSFKIPVPAIDAQRKIAAVLSAYDDLIENNRRRIALLERMAEQLYREWFVRFRFPGHQRAKFEKGVPRDWTKARFSDLCTLQRGFDLPDSQIVEGNYPVVASTSIKAFHHAFKVEPPVITTGRSGSLGDVLWINQRAWPLNTALYVKDFRENSPYFVFHTLRTMHLENFNSGAGVPSLNRNHLISLPIAIPPRGLQEAFANQVGPMQSLKEKLERACVELAKTRDLLLPRLISGKLRVDQLDIQFPPSMQAEHA